MTLVLVEQRSSESAGAPWVIDAGRRREGLECPARTRALRQGLEGHTSRVVVAGARDEQVEATLLACHEPGYLRALRTVEGELEMMDAWTAPGMAPDTPVCREAVATACEGARTAISTAQELLDGQRFAYGLCRPPGHHAGPSWLGGYCYLNNAAAAVHTLRAGGMRDVAVIDLDLHYPNGTSAILSSMPGVTLYSLHAMPVTNVPPGTALPAGPHEHVHGFARAPSEREYTDALARALESVSGREGIVVSLGFDTVHGDPHGCWELSPGVFRRVGEMLAATEAPLCVIQEGGYALAELSACAENFAIGVLEGARS